MTVDRVDGFSKASIGKGQRRIDHVLNMAAESYCSNVRHPVVSGHRSQIGPIGSNRPIADVPD